MIRFICLFVIYFQCCSVLFQKECNTWRGGEGRKGMRLWAGSPHLFRSPGQSLEPAFGHHVLRLPHLLFPLSNEKTLFLGFSAAVRTYSPINKEFWSHYAICKIIVDNFLRWYRKLQYRFLDQDSFIVQVFIFQKH